MAANPNTLQGIQEVWDKVYQVTHHKRPIYPAISNFRLAQGLQKGDTVHRQYRNQLVANDMAGDGGYTTQAITDTDETLTVSFEKETSFYLKDLDALQNQLPVQMRHAEDASIAIFNQVDADVLGQYDQFTNSLDDGDLGGTAGNGISLTTSNIMKLFSNSTRLLQRANIAIDTTAEFTGVKFEDMKKDMMVAAISPDVYAVIIERLEGKDSALGDKIGIEGHAGKYMNYNLFISNSVGWSGTLLLGTQPTDADTVTINGVTFTFKTTLGTTAGNVLIGASNDTAITNLVALINDPATTTANGVALSAANQILMKNIAATADTTNNLITIKAKGKGFVIVSETLTAAADIWTAAKQVQHCLLGVANSIDVVIQKTPGIKTVPVTGKVGMDFVTWAAYGIKVFNDGKAKMIDVWVRTDAYTA